MANGVKPKAVVTSELLIPVMNPLSFVKSLTAVGIAGIAAVPLDTTLVPPTVTSVTGTVGIVGLFNKSS